MNRRASITFASASILLCVLGAAGSPPSATQGVEAPTPPRELPADSVVYRTLGGREAQVTFTSAAPLERIVGKSNAVRGFALRGPADHPANLAGAEWVLPVRSLATGLPLRDEHLAGRDWLDADAHPAIRFVLTRMEEVKEVKKGDGFSTWSGTLVGTMTLHGVARALRVPDAKFSFLSASEKTRAIAPGDLLFIRCEYSVRLSDFGIANSDVPDKVSDVVQLSQLLRLSSASADELNKAASERGTPPSESPTSESPKSESPNATGSSGPSGR